MRRWPFLAGGVLLGFLVSMAAVLWGSGAPTAALAQGPTGSGDIALVYGVGGVLTRDGILWQYRPDKGSWVTVDDAFSEEGRETHVLPLPVAVGEIAQMESFGFLVTKSGACWLYDLEKDRWRDVGPPPARR